MTDVTAEFLETADAPEPADGGPVNQEVSRNTIV